MNNLAGLKMVHIPYKGSPLSDVLAGQVPLAFEPATTALPLIKTGKLVGLAITSAKRNPAMPDIPTVSEVLPGYEGDGWQGIYMPAGTPKEIVARMNAEIVKILKQPDIQQKLTDLGLQPVGNTVEEFERISIGELDKWGKLAKSNNIRVE